MDAVGEEEEDFGSDRGSERSQALAADALLQIRFRVDWCGDGYPFNVYEDYLMVRSEEPNTSHYVFCLLLSVAGHGATRSARYPDRLFEEICLQAGIEYLHGNGVSFGAPRRVLPSRFRDAVDALCARLREGGGYSGRSRRLHYQDDGLDLVVWRDFGDPREGKVIIFGQCASGKDWEKKITQDLPRAFCTLHFLQPPAVPPVAALFLPRQVPEESWPDLVVRDGILFDRCRISELLAESVLPPDCARWIMGALRGHST